MTNASLQTSAPLHGHNFDAHPRTAWALVALVDDGELVLDAPYQRGSVWTTDQRRALIRSFLMGVPIPSLVLNDRGNPDWREANSAEQVYVVVDGKQRIEATLAWFRGELDVPASWFPAEQVASTHMTTDGAYVSFDELTKPGQVYLKRGFTFPWAVAKVATLAEEAEIFVLINGAGTAQSQDTMDAAAAIASGRTA